MTPVAQWSVPEIHPCMFDVLTQGPESACGQCLVGSLTSRGAPQRVTEHEGWLILVGHQEVSAMA